MKNFKIIKKTVVVKTNADTGGYGRKPKIINRIITITLFGITIYKSELTVDE
jgi:hypothetical protein